MINNIQINKFFYLFCEFLSTNQICFCEVVACVFQSTAHFEPQDNENPLVSYRLASFKIMLLDR